MMKLLLRNSFILTFCLVWSINLNAHSAKPLHIYSAKPDSTTIYATNFNVLKYNFSGLIYFIRNYDNSIRVLMTSEMGPKIIDLTITPSSYTVNFVIRQMNRKRILNTMYEDFGAIAGVFQTTPLTSPNNQELSNSQKYIMPSGKLLIKRTSNKVLVDSSSVYIFNKKKRYAKIEYFYENKSQVIDSICLKHQNMNMNISLKKINQ